MAMTNAERIEFLKMTPAQKEAFFKNKQIESDAVKRAKVEIDREGKSIKRGSGGLKQASDIIKRNQMEKHRIMNEMARG